MPELEVWLIGTPNQLDAAITATGRHVLPADPDDHPKQVPLSGEDRGRSRLYLRIAITSDTTPPRRNTAARRHAATTDQGAIDLNAYRRSA